MSVPGDSAEPVRGYLSEESKRRFTLVAGVLGAVTFLAQMLLPVAIVFATMASLTLGGAMRMAEVQEAALWRDEVWFVERTMKLDFRDPGNSMAALALRRVRLADLEEAGAALSLGEIEADDRSPSLLALGDRLWLIGAEAVGYAQDAAVTWLSGVRRPPRSTRPFAYEGRPAVITLKAPTSLATLQVEGERAEWVHRELPLGLPAESGGLRSLQAVEAGGGLALFAELCTEQPEHCAIHYRRADEAEWRVAVEDAGHRTRWTAVASGPDPVVVRQESGEQGARRLVVVTVTAGRPRWEIVEAGAKGGPFRTAWHAFSVGGRLLVLSSGMPGSLRLDDVRDGRIVDSVQSGPSSLVFPRKMMAIILAAQLAPFALSMLLALLLTVQMRRHRVQDYVVAGTRRRFATLWQRAIAQLVDLVPLGAPFLLPMVPMWRMFSAPERYFENEAAFPLHFFAFFVLAFFCALGVLVAYSWLEGRWGKTPGKWLVGIRVLGTDLAFCGFGRAFLRNVLTFVDGFLNFLVGAMMVALTENWQRLGDLAARTVVVRD